MPDALSRERAVELWDLSRTLDRLAAIRHELDDIGLTKIGAALDDCLRAACHAAESAVLVAQTRVENRIGDPANYQPDDGRDAA